MFLSYSVVILKLKFKEYWVLPARLTSVRWGYSVLGGACPTDVGQSGVLGNSSNSWFQIFKLPADQVINSYNNTQDHCNVIQSISKPYHRVDRFKFYHHKEP